MSALCGIGLALAMLEGVMNYCPPPPPPLDAGTAGWLSRYDEAPTVDTLAYRRYIGDIPPVEDYAYLAVADCSLIGRRAWVRIEDSRIAHTPWMEAYVFDCAGHASTVEWMAEDGILAELDWFTARQWGYTGRHGVYGRVLIEGDS